MQRTCYCCPQSVIKDEGIANIHDYVGNALKENGPLNEMLTNDHALRDEVIDTLTSRAHGKYVRFPVKTIFLHSSCLDF